MVLYTIVQVYASCAASTFGIFSFLDCKKAIRDYNKSIKISGSVQKIYYSSGGQIVRQKIIKSRTHAVTLTFVERFFGNIVLSIIFPVSWFYKVAGWLYN